MFFDNRRSTAEFCPVTYFSVVFSSSSTGIYKVSVSSNSSICIAGLFTLDKG